MCLAPHQAARGGARLTLHGSLSEPNGGASPVRCIDGEVFLSRDFLTSRGAPWERQDYAGCWGVPGWQGWGLQLPDSSSRVAVRGRPAPLSLYLGSRDAARRRTPSGHPRQVASWVACAGQILRGGTYGLG